MLENAVPRRPRAFTRVCLLLTRAVVGLVAFFELFLLCSSFARSGCSFFVDFFEVLVLPADFFVDFTFLLEAFFELVDFFFLFLMAIRAV